jgi:hypothetical protein
MSDSQGASFHKVCPHKALGYRSGTARSFVAQIRVRSFGHLLDQEVPPRVCIVQISSNHLEPLAFLFNRISEDTTAVHLHPHPFNPAETKLRANYAGQDCYALMLLGNEAIGYGFLRGWDEKYAIP